MFITKEALDKREQVLRSDMEAINGALQEVAFWRAFLEREMDVPATPDDDVPTLAQVVEDLLGPTAEPLEVVRLADPEEEVV